jgi:hypothetical protein
MSEHEGLEWRGFANQAEAAAAFEALQRKLVPLWRSIEAMNQDPQTIVVVPSLTVDKLLQGQQQQAYEERFLFLLLLLRQPRARLVYVTSLAIHPNIIDYYLGLLPGVVASHARKRLFLVSPLDASPKPLSLKLLERPKLIEQIRGLVLDPGRAHLVPYNTTVLERDLALRLGIPMYGCDPRHFPLGTKSGGRRLFAEADVPYPLGIEDLRGPDDLIRALAEIRARRPGMRQAIVKLNEGVSGEGNALIDLGGLPAPGASAERDALRDRLRTMRFELPETTWEIYEAKLRDRGGVVEERIMGSEFRSPSAQLRVTPLGKVERLSTHDQLLGGPSGQIYLGCKFPADPAYAGPIMNDAAAVGDLLAREGVIGRFALDFVSVRDEAGRWSSYAIEINLRKGGTTHPFLTLQFLTDGAYDPEKGVFLTRRGEPKCFVATDRQESHLFRVFAPDDLFDIVVRHGLHFDQARQTGVVMHMMSALGDCGHLGLTAVGNTHAEAEALFARAAQVLEDEARLMSAQPRG